MKSRRKSDPSDRAIAFAKLEAAHPNRVPSEHCTCCGGSKYPEWSAMPLCICTEPDWKIS